MTTVNSNAVECEYSLIQVLHSFFGVGGWAVDGMILKDIIVLKLI